MADVAICAMCGDKKELLRSARINGIMEPRVCKECLIESFKIGWKPVNQAWWVTQWSQLGDIESIKKAEINLPSKLTHFNMVLPDGRRIKALLLDEDGPISERGKNDENE